jgi:hypothetical protein
MFIYMYKYTYIYTYAYIDMFQSEYDYGKALYIQKFMLLFGCIFVYLIHTYE